jgi:hypothetical protein
VSTAWHNLGIIDDGLGWQVKATQRSEILTVNLKIALKYEYFT